MSAVGLGRVETRQRRGPVEWREYWRFSGVPARQTRGRREVRTFRDEPQNLLEHLPRDGDLGSA